MANSHNLDPYATHLPMLQMLLATFTPGLVIEFGPGNFSTKLFIDNAEKVISIEMQSQEWYDTVAKTHHLAIKKGKLDLRLALGANTYNTLDFGKEVPGMAFIDGHFDSRTDTANLMFQMGCPIVICHDFEYKGYNWDRLKVPVNFNHIITYQRVPNEYRFVECIAFFRNDVFSLL